MRKSEIISDWFQNYHQDVYNFLVYYTGRRDCEDLVQEVFIKALRGLDHFNGQSNPKTWLFSIARNVAIDESRKLKRRGLDRTSPLEESPEPSTVKTPDDFLQEQETQQQLYQMIEKLRDSYRDVLVLRGIKDLSVYETACVLGWSESKVKTTYLRAKKALQAMQGGFHIE
ncbi:RNA polymerase sigma factor [Aquisalibacillus elongatus]|uniref:RNA polymerase sigma-70 factor (ECF subfamily) n=1 Tax=Aquisalibacillus elongatus TaxID=485577 RepID=A0A3N5C6W3_9BACI|nr:RNA polymerase sigma factor [Aquisalibacillus elongatus]RPF52171.1 RNA polymerase sigma-70 factor (ECF subfamily) [Aquisalibacillus elongatus]